jgi:hypothetical protein
MDKDARAKEQTVEGQSLRAQWLHEKVSLHWLEPLEVAESL